VREAGGGCSVSHCDHAHRVVEALVRRVTPSQAALPERGCARHVVSLVSAPEDIRDVARAAHRRERRSGLVADRTGAAQPITRSTGGLARWVIPSVRCRHPYCAAAIALRSPEVTGYGHWTGAGEDLAPWTRRRLGWDNYLPLGNCSPEAAVWRTACAWGDTSSGASRPLPSRSQSAGP
jgi:hypothetical protein